MRLRSVSRFTCTLFALAFILSATSFILASRPLPIAQAQPNDSSATRIVLPDGTVKKGAKPQPGITVVRNVQLPSQSSCAAAAPALLVPVGGVISNDLENPRYTWAAVPAVTEFVFQVARDSAFADLLTTSQQTTTPDKSQITFTSFDDLKASTVYYWRVASVCADGQIGVFSAPASFQTGPGNTNPTCTLPPPTLLEPAPNTQVTTLIPRIVWNREPNTFEYRYQLSADSTFATRAATITFIGIDPTASGGITEVPTDNLLPDTLYYWRVASICADVDAISSFSAPFTFRSGSAGGTFLPPPALIAPVDGAVTGSIRITFLYDAVATANAYRINLYASAQDAEDDDWFFSLGAASTNRVDVENPEETIYWRVKTQNEYGWGPLSETRSFTTPTVNASSQISPESGGTLSPNPGYLTVNFPPGAVASSTDLNFNLLATPQQRLPNFRFANRAFTLEAFAGAEQLTHFDKPFTMAVTYDTSDLLAAGIGDASQLNLVFWNGSAWETILPCAGCSVDTTNHKVTVVIDHLTEFALVAPGAEADIHRVYLPVVLK